MFLWLFLGLFAGFDQTVLSAYVVGDCLVRLVVRLFDWFPLLLLLRGCRVAGWFAGSFVQLVASSSSTSSSSSSFLSFFLSFVLLLLLLLLLPYTDLLHHIEDGVTVRGCTTETKLVQSLHNSPFPFPPIPSPPPPPPHTHTHPPNLTFLSVYTAFAVLVAAVH